jgi:5-(carboxyamino)imidazole ribonucleotide synthase
LLFLTKNLHFAALTLLESLLKFSNKKMINHKKHNRCGYPFLRLGIIGGGQLGRMMASKAKQMGFFVAVLDPTPNSPAGQFADVEITGDFYDPQKLQELVQLSEIATYDIEHIDAPFLKQLAKSGCRIHPAPEILETIQDKLRQKEILARHGIPAPRFLRADKIDLALCSRFGFPAAQKLRFGGYDGRGVKILRTPEDVDAALPGESVLEEYVALEKELAVMAARSLSGEITCYPAVEMQFAAPGNILDVLIAPARIDQATQQQAQEISIACVEALQGVGVFGVELFLSKPGKLLVNEIAPRPHNSGHYTIEACATSQFEQHLRAITGLPLGSTQLLQPAVMLNLLGEPNFSGPPVIEGWRETLAMPGLSFHWYGKAETRPLRKMGHVTIINEYIEEALRQARRVKEVFKIKASPR